MKLDKQIVLRPIVLAFSLVAATMTVAAAETSGLAELGYLARSGNTDSSDLNAKFKIAQTYGVWTQSFHASAELAEENNQRSGQRYTAGVKSEYRLSANDYVFATIDYESDKFAAYRLRWSEAVGYGRRLINQTQQTLDLEAGLGARQTTLQDLSKRDSMIVRLGLAYAYKFATTASFSNKLLLEDGKDNTYLSNEAALDMPLLDKVSLKVSYTVRHNSNVPAATEKTDTLTAVNLAYRF